MVSPAMADPAQVQALIAGDQGAFEQLITALMGSDNQSRQAAEGLFNQMKEANGDACVTNLVALLRTSPQQDSRTLTAVLLRKVCYDAMLLQSSIAVAARSHGLPPLYRC